jgi:hypothetical protein
MSILSSLPKRFGNNPLPKYILTFSNVVINVKDKSAVKLLLLLRPP